MTRGEHRHQPISNIGRNRWYRISWVFFSHVDPVFRRKTYIRQSSLFETQKSHIYSNEWICVCVFFFFITFVLRPFYVCPFRAYKGCALYRITSSRVVVLKLLAVCFTKSDIDRTINRWPDYAYLSRCHLSVAVFFVVPRKRYILTRD